MARRLQVTHAAVVAQLTGALQGFGADLGSFALSSLNDNLSDQQGSLAHSSHSSNIR